MVQFPALGDRLTVGRQILNLSVVVRVHVPQPDFLSVKRLNVSKPLVQAARREAAHADFDWLRDCEFVQCHAGYANNFYCSITFFSFGNVSI